MQYFTRGRPCRKRPQTYAVCLAARSSTASTGNRPVCSSIRSTRVERRPEGPEEIHPKGIPLLYEREQGLAFGRVWTNVVNKTDRPATLESP